MSDLKNYIEKRKQKDKAFAKDYEMAKEKKSEVIKAIREYEKHLDGQPADVIEIRQEDIEHSEKTIRKNSSPQSPMR